MTQEQIEKVAGDYSGTIFGFDSPIVKAKNKAFQAGAKWRIESVWHDGNEIPKFGCPILGITIFGEPIIDGPFGIEYDVNIDMSNIKKWAYMTDLLTEE